MKYDTVKVYDLSIENIRNELANSFAFPPRSLITEVGIPSSKPVLLLLSSSLIHFFCLKD